MRNDLVDVFKATLEADGFRDVFPTLADGHRHKESISLAMGVPEAPTTYFDLDQSVKMRITCYVRRISELDAQTDAVEAERAIRNAALESENGSYRIIRKETTRPAILPWDDSGRYVYFFETTIEYKEA